MVGHPLAIRRCSIGANVVRVTVLACASLVLAACSSNFANTIHVGRVTLGGNSGTCPSVTLGSMSVTVSNPSRIDAYGSGVYHQNGSDLNVVSLHLELTDANGSAVAVSSSVPISAPYSGPVSPNNGNAFGAVSGVLQAGSNTSLVTNGGGSPFVAASGQYTLKLILSPASSPCPQQSYIGFVTLSYQLASTTP